jgi:uncharacterized protein (TIGR03067 family)
MRYEFTADGQWFIRRDGAAVKSVAREYKVDPKAKPATIDMATPVPANAAPFHPMLGIYKIEGDTLTLCYSTGGGERPKSFEPEAGARVVVMVLKRAKKEK